MKKKVIFMMLGILLILGMGNMEEKTLTAEAAVRYTSVTVEGLDPTGKTDATDVIQQYLNLAKEKASDGNVYKIIIPAGTYRIEKSLKIYSNTYLYMKGATLKRCTTKGGMLRTGDPGDKINGYSGYRNITLDGGTWNANCNVSAYKDNNASCIRVAHAKNITIKNTSMINGNNLHFVEVAGIDGFTLQKCQFKGMEKTNKKNTKNNEIEAVQIDVLSTAERMDNFYNYDDTPMKNISITGCTFDNVQKGIGGHAFVMGKYFENVKIQNNTFSNITRTAITFDNYRNCTITGNTITKCGVGIEIRSMHSAEGLKAGTAKAYMPHGKTKPVINPNAATVISNNTISVAGTKYVSTPCAVYVVGENIDSKTAAVAGIPKGNYYIKNVTLSGNRITTKGIGVKLEDAKYCKVINNTINYTGGAASTSFYNICAYDGSAYLTLQGNTVTNAPKHAIYLNRKCSNATITKNVVDGAQGSGINLYNCGAGHKISSNKISNTAKDGIICENSSGTIQGNQVTKASRNGITVVHGTVATIRKNKVTDVAGRGIMVDEGARATVTSNTAKKCGLYGIDVVDPARTSTVKQNTVASSGKCNIHVMHKSSLSLRTVSAPKIRRVTVKKKSIVLKLSGKDKAAKYYVYRRTGNGSYKKIGSTTKTTYTDKKVKKGKKYTYKVVSCAKKGKVTVTTAYSKPSKQVKAK